MSRYPWLMPTLQFVAGAMFVGAIVMFFLAFVLVAGQCSSGYTFLYLGVGLMLTGGAVAALGGTLVLIPVGILGLVFVVLGLVVANGAGCSI